MALMEKKYIERIVIVLAEDKTIKAVHEESLNEIWKDDVQIAGTSLGAVTLSPDTLLAVLPDAHEALVQVVTQQGDIARLNAEIINERTKNTDVQAQLDQALADLATTAEIPKSLAEFKAIS